MKNLKGYVQKHALKCIIFAFFFGIFISVGLTTITYLTSTPEFCGSCHSMQEPYATFMQAKHQAQNCTECHLPHDNIASYMLEKGRSGIVDFYHEFMEDYPDKIFLSERGRQMVNKNCLRCHYQSFDKVHADITSKKDNCLKCHRKVAHDGY